jgi:hypothetical protein
VGEGAGVGGGSAEDLEEASVVGAPPGRAVTSLTELSDAALHYGAVFELDDAEILGARLYGFHRYPLSPKLVRLLPGSDQLRQFVLREAPPELTRYWRSQRYEGRAGWLYWARRGAPDLVRRITPKLYVSPPPTMIREALRELVPVLTQSSCLRFKVAATPSYLARTDKLVAYFDDRAEMLQLGEVLMDRLQGIPVHGVPFSSPVFASASSENIGLVSWGVDPPSAGDRQASWRSWLCREIALAMTSSEPNARLAAARTRVQSLGIDVASWAAPPHFWESGLSAAATGAN